MLKTVRKHPLCNRVMFEKIRRITYFTKCQKRASSYDNHNSCRCRSLVDRGYQHIDTQHISKEASLLHHHHQYIFLDLPNICIVACDHSVSLELFPF
jgi:hypothetical protein